MRTEINILTGNRQVIDDLEPTGEMTTEEIISQYVAAMESVFNAVARAKNYDSKITCYMRSGCPDSPFHAEGKSYATWVDACNACAYQELEKVINGQRPVPTVEQFLSELPSSPW